MGGGGVHCTMLQGWQLPVCQEGGTVIVHCTMLQGWQPHPMSGGEGVGWGMGGPLHYAPRMATSPHVRRGGGGVGGGGSTALCSKDGNPTQCQEGKEVSSISEYHSDLNGKFSWG